MQCFLKIHSRLASKAQLDARPTQAMRRLLVRPLLGWQHSPVEIDHEIFSKAILSLLLIQEGQLSVSGGRMRTILVNRLEDEACPGKVWLVNKTPLGWLDHNTITQTKTWKDTFCISLLVLKMTIHRLSYTGCLFFFFFFLSFAFLTQF